jgi:hypothetical protein
VWYWITTQKYFKRKKKVGGVHIKITGMPDSNQDRQKSTTFKLEGEVTSLSKSSQGEVGDNREKWGDF